MARSSKRNRNNSQNIIPTREVASASQKSSSSIVEVSKTKWYIILTLVLTIFGAVGGIPGIVAAFEYMDDKPKFHFAYSNISYGITGRGTGVLLSGTVSNVGKKPILIRNFQLDLVVDGETYATEPSAIEDSLTLNSDSFTLDLNNPKDHDLMKLGRLDPNDAVSGTLQFLTKEIHSETFR